MAFSGRKTIGRLNKFGIWKIYRKQFTENNSLKAIDRTESLSNGKFIERIIYRTGNLSIGELIELQLTEQQLTERRIDRTGN